ncbi:acyl-CoA dehydrogenase [Ahniella affigens]|uniref:Acyl-coenzyme A dehydrogenase n=1 Tax=Ahniella affigens TaxID=2021234 RepID=A0A2P1PUA3_9GAMM|nr:acyl-CoA dehydrogenase [Ahniella affigens]AVP98423.1 acyl-CoA dehydrogenase [Ahniella affigens]
MAIALPILAVLLTTLISAYRRFSLATWTLFSAIAIGAAAAATWPNWLPSAIVGGVFALIALITNVKPLRRLLISGPFLKVYQTMTPQLSETEKVALEAGTVGWEGELFSGRPDWSKLKSQPKPQLTSEEQAFLDGPCDELCRLHDDFEATHHRADLSPQVWDYLKKNKFFGMIIPKQYGGLGFSALAHHAVVQKCASLSGTLSSTVCVPNSLGPAELLLHYGTEDQKNHYLPRLARGEEIPCFALTNPYAGSDATSIPDFGIVCKGQHQGQDVLGVRLTFDKRYITLAPVATVVGLAFRLHDPDKHLSDVSDRGITLALIPRSTPGLEVGRRHFPLNVPFQNGPVRGKDVFIPLSYLIGGPEYIGQGWRMLVECLSVGRAISLPSSSAGGVRMGAVATGAYARIRKQFQMPIGRFEGVEEALARIGGKAYATTALARMTAAAVDLGEKPAVPSAIAKYHATENGATVVKDVMDIHGGKGIILGPSNYVGRAYQAAPISITVEGANILTRSMIIFGQGAIRCHPYVLKELHAAQEADPKTRLVEFDKQLFGHIGFAISNGVRAFLLGLTHSRLAKAPMGDATTAKFYRKITRYSATLALVADTAMLTLGARLKVKEKLSGRLGDVLSQLYIMSAMLKRYEDQGRPTMDYPMLAWAMHDAVYAIQNALDGVLRNFPIRPVAWALRALVFPIGLRERAPGDRLGHRVATLLMSPNEARDRLAEGIYLTPNANNPVGRMVAGLPKVIAAEPVERKLMKAIKAGQLKALEFGAQIDEALQQGIITSAERELLIEVRAITHEVISVDDFDPSELESAVDLDKPKLKSVA